MKDRDKIRLNKLTKEFKEGFEFFESLKKGVVIFGSARTNANDYYYKKAYKLAYKLAQKRFPIITGAGKGIMEAGNKGAKEAGGVSIGLNIDLPEYQERNYHITHYFKFNHFYTRKVIFTKYSFASVVFPGGYGTVDELFDQLAVLQNSKIPPRPIIIVGKSYYAGLINWMKKVLYKRKRISKKDLNLFKVTDNIDEIIKIIETEYKATRKFFI